MTELIQTSRDQILPIQATKALAEVDAIIENSLDEKDLDIALDFCRNKVEGMKLSGLSLAKALYLIQANWEHYEIGDNYIDTMFYALGIHRHTIDRYNRVWEMLLQIPKEYKNDVQQLGMRAMIPIANALHQGYNIENNQWEKLSQSIDSYEVSKYVREEIKEAPPRKSGLTIKIDRSGSLFAYTSLGMVFIGSLEINDPDEIVKKAIARIINNARILEE